MKAAQILLLIAAIVSGTIVGRIGPRKWRVTLPVGGALILLALLCAGCGNSHGTPDILGGEGPKLDVIRARVDPLTGCEYITYRYGGITPRMGADGKQICREVKP